MRRVADMAPGRRHPRRSRVRLLAALVGCTSLLAVVPLKAATPASQDVGAGGAPQPSTITWTGASIQGNPDPVGPPSPTCTAGCDREAFKLHAPTDAYTATNVISVTATATFDPGASGGTADIAILDNNNNVLASTTASGSPATVIAKDLPANVAGVQYVVEVDGDIGDPVSMTTYAGQLSASAAPRTIQAAHGDGGITPSRETVADPFRLGTEPTIAVSPDGTTYEGPIFGFSTTQSFVERSDNGGQTFNTLGAPGAGKNTACPGGGDEDISTDQSNNLYFFDLGGAPVVPAAVSPDHGNTFVANCLANDTATNPNRPNSFPDRQWLSTDIKHNREWYIWRDGLVNATTPTDPVAGPVYGEFITSAPLPSPAPSPAGAPQLLFTHLCQNGTGQGVPCFSDVAVAGNAVTDNSSTSPGYGKTYLAMTGHGGVGVAVIDPTAAIPVVEKTAVPTASGGNAVLFPTVAVDRSGIVYEAYTDAASFQVMFTESTNQGTTWTTPVVVNGAPAATTVMPWIVAGDAGRVDLVFYGSSSTAAPSTNSGPWNVYLLQNLAANVDHSFASWTQSLLTDRPNHVEPVCLSGLGCTTNTGPGGDRELGDFFRVVLDKDGRAMVSFADGNNQLGQEVAPQAAAPSFAHFVRQATGPSLYTSAGTVPPIAVPTNTVTVGGHHDPFPFASPACPCPDNAALNLLTSTTSSDGSNVHIHLVISNLDAVTPITPPEQPTATYLTRWWFNGKVYFAAAEDNASTGFRYFSGQASPVSDGLAIKYAYYPSSGSATGAVVTGPNGTIDLTVPVGQVGNPTANQVLYSVTSYTLTHTSPTAPNPPVGSGNFTDLPAVVDVLPAYNVVPNTTAVPEARTTILLLAVGVLGIAVAVMPRRRRRLRAA
ncbi:MAG: hypothetical protein M3019_00870 [Candidatus Dormibacteraeota bacterium]|nr:hypothetical protein [Candidatus Dormibacteraeota bacterium]